MNRSDYDAALKALQQNRKSAVDRMAKAESITQEMIDLIINNHIMIEATIAVRDDK